MYSPPLSLANPPTDSPIADGVSWAQGVALGSTATVIAALAVAAIGLLMLSGRLELRRGTTVVIGCFILFGAPTIAAAITGIKAESYPLEAPAGHQPSKEPPQLPAPVPAQSPTAYDPYAGASVPTVR